MLGPSEVAGALLSIDTGRHSTGTHVTPKQEAELLMNGVLLFAEQMLRRHGEFSPYGGVLRMDGSIVRVGVQDPKTDHPSSASPIETLREQLRERVERGEAKAAAIVLDVRVTPPGAGHASEAIEVLVQHRESYCADIFLPYGLKKGGLTFGQMFARTCGKQILG
jgi:hypothetical protein